MLSNLFIGSLFFQDAAANIQPVPVQVTGVELPDGSKMPRSLKATSHGSAQSGWCQDLQGDWYRAGTVITNSRQHRQATCQWNGSWSDADTCPTDMNDPRSRLVNNRNCWYGCYGQWTNNCNNWCSCTRSLKLGSSGPNSQALSNGDFGASSGGDPFNGQDPTLGTSSNGPALGMNWRWMFPGTEGAPCWFDKWCYGGLECRSLLGAGSPRFECVRDNSDPWWPVPSPAPVINWGGNSNGPAPAPVPVPFGRRRSSDSLRRLQEQIEN